MLNIPYGDPIRIHLKEKTFTSLKPFFIGLATQSYQFKVAGEELKCFVVEFTDLGFYALFRENVQAFADTLIDVEEVVASRRMQQLQPLLTEAKEPSAKIAIAEHFLLQFLPDKRTLDRIRRAETALQLIRKYKGLISMQVLADEVCLSGRQFSFSSALSVPVIPKER